MTFISFNLYRKNSQLESALKETGKIEDEVVTFYEVMLRIFMNAEGEMRRIDKRGAFSSDDEVGFGFKVIKTSIENVVVQLKSLKSLKEKNEEKEKE